MSPCSIVDFLYPPSAGPLALAAKWLTASEEPFFVLNSDVICAFPFEELKAAHAKNGGLATIAVSRTSTTFHSLHEEILPGFLFLRRS